MEWMINFLCALVLTTLTGSVLMVVWYFVGKKLDDMGRINILYHILRCNTVFFFVPVAYLALQFFDEWIGLFQGELFLRTPWLLSVAPWIFGIWLAGVIVAAGYTVMNCIQLYWRCKQALPVPEKTNILMRHTCQDMGFRGESVQVLRSYQAQVPYLVGVVSPKVMLPMEEYSEEELRITFIHELTHYQQKDLWMKWAAMLLLCIHWFNPLAWRYHKIVKHWSEYACDFFAYQKAGSAKAYLTVMSKIALHASEQSNALVAAWYENQAELVTRIERVARYQKLPTFSRWRAGLLCVVMLLINVMGIGATALAMANGYMQLYQKTEVLQEDFWGEQELLTEMTEVYQIDSKREHVAMPRESLNSQMNAVHWFLTADCLKKTEVIEGIIGLEMEVHISSIPSDAEIRVGVLTPDGTKRYVSGKKSLTHTFDIGGMRWYQFFVENVSERDIDVIGTYVIR